MTNIQEEQQASSAPATAEDSSAGYAGNGTARAKSINDYHLSKQELRILQGLANGDPNKVIAHHLGITEATVKVHVKTILRKLGTTNRTKAAIFAITQGISPGLEQARELAA